MTEIIQLGSWECTCPDCQPPPCLCTRAHRPYRGRCNQCFLGEITNGLHLITTFERNLGRPDFQPAYQTSTRAPPTPWQSVPRTYSSKPTFPPHTYSKLYILYIWFKLICKLHPPVLPARQTDFGHSVHCEGPAPCLWGHLAEEKNFGEGKNWQLANLKKWSRNIAPGVHWCTGATLGLTQRQGRKDQEQNWNHCCL